MTIPVTIGANSYQILTDSDLPAGRTKLSPGATTFYVNFATGSNVTGDGTSGNPWKSLQWALGQVLNNFDFYGNNNGSKAIIQMADNTTDTDGVHFSPHAFVGAQGGAAVKIKGGVNSKIITNNKSALQFYFGCVIQLQDIEIGCTGQGNGLDVAAGAQVYLMNGIKFGSCVTSHINMEDGFIYGGGSYSISGSAAYHLVNNGGRFKTNGVTIDITASLSFTSFILLAAPCMTTFQNSAINLNGNTVTGKRYDVYNNAVLLSADGNANYFPGSVAGSVSSGGIYN